MYMYGMKVLYRYVYDNYICNTNSKYIIYKILLVYCRNHIVLSYVHRRVIIMFFLPMLLVKITMVFLKLTTLPLLSVNLDIYIKRVY